MRLSVVTPTGDRPEAFALCETWMGRQTFAPHEWLVYCDGAAPTRVSRGQILIRCPEWAGRGSLVRKVRDALARTTGDAIVIVEDDDWYAPGWLAWCAEQLKTVAVVGEGCSIYVNVRGRWYHEHGNMGHASLCSTAFRRDAFALVADACADEAPYIDTRIWPLALAAEMGRIVQPARHGNLVVGIKSMPGRPGYGWGHQKRPEQAKADPEMRMLAGLVGRDVLLYEPFMQSERTHAHGPNWKRWLGDIAGQPDIAGLELGTWKGESAEWFCENIFTDASARYVCVDHWQGSVEHQEQGTRFEEIEAIARQRLARFVQVEIRKGRSADYLRSLSSPCFDFIYVDAAHDSANVLRDTVLAWDLLQLGGVLVWDDYAWTVMPTEVERPKLAIDAFLRCYSPALEELPGRGWQVAVRKVRA